MTLCPIAMVAGCSKCPVVKVCPLKSVIGDYKSSDDVPAPPPAARPRDAADARKGAGRKR